MAEALSLITQFIAALNTVIGVAVFLCGGALLIAFGRSTRYATGAPKHFQKAIWWICGAYIWRDVYWNPVRSFARWASPEFWEAWTVIVGGLNVNLVWNVSFLIATYHGLMAIHMSIPASDRSEWPVWKAWLYPPWSSPDEVGAVTLIRWVQTNIRAHLSRKKRGQD